MTNQSVLALKFKAERLFEIMKVQRRRQEIDLQNEESFIKELNDSMETIASKTSSLKRSMTKLQITQSTRKLLLPEDSLLYNRTSRSRADSRIGQNKDPSFLDRDSRRNSKSPHIHEPTLIEGIESPPKFRRPSHNTPKGPPKLIQNPLSSQPFLSKPGSRSNSKPRVGGLDFSLPKSSWVCQTSEGFPLDNGEIKSKIDFISGMKTPEKKDKNRIKDQLKKISSKTQSKHQDYLQPRLSMTSLALNKTLGHGNDSKKPHESTSHLAQRLLSKKSLLTEAKANKNKRDISPGSSVNRSSCKPFKAPKISADLANFLERKRFTTESKKLFSKTAKKERPEQAGQFTRHSKTRTTSKEAPEKGSLRRAEDFLNLQQRRFSSVKETSHRLPAKEEECQTKRNKIFSGHTTIGEQG